jgi:hypothetical protein
MPLKGLDSSRLRAMGWNSATNFRSALSETYRWFLRHILKEDLKDVRAAV